MSMMLPSDEQIIERVRRAQRYRRPLGAACTVLGLAGVALVLFLVHGLRAQSLALLEQLGRVPEPTAQRVAQVLDHARFNSGFGIGLILAGGLSGASGLAASGLVWLLVSSRKDRLLLKCWDERSTAR